MKSNEVTNPHIKKQHRLYLPTTMTSTLKDFFRCLHQDKVGCDSMIILEDKAATHCCRTLHSTSRPQQECESRWGTITSDQHTYQNYASKSSRWNTITTSSPVNKKRNCLVTPPQRRTSFDDVQKGAVRSTPRR